MNDRIRYVAAPAATGDSALTLGIVVSINRLVRGNGALAAGRACAASVRAATRHVLPAIPNASR
jgi:hypothetical protein